MSTLPQGSYMTDALVRNRLNTKFLNMMKMVLSPTADA
jgi:hypothetical protein